MLLSLLRSPLTPHPPPPLGNDSCIFQQCVCPFWVELIVAACRRQINPLFLLLSVSLSVTPPTPCSSSLFSISSLHGFPLQSNCTGLFTFKQSRYKIIKGPLALKVGHDHDIWSCLQCVNICLQLSSVLEKPCAPTGKCILVKGETPAKLLNWLKRFSLFPVIFTLIKTIPRQPWQSHMSVPIASPALLMNLPITFTITTVFQMQKMINRRQRQAKIQH